MTNEADEFGPGGLYESGPNTVPPYEDTVPNVTARAQQTIYGARRYLMRHNEAFYGSMKDARCGCSECKLIRALLALVERTRQERDVARNMLADLTPSADGGYGPYNGAAWKDAYIARLRETFQAERERDALLEQTKYVYVIAFDEEVFGIFRTKEAAEKDLEEQINGSGPAWEDCKVVKRRVEE